MALCEDQQDTEIRNEALTHRQLAQRSSHDFSASVQIRLACVLAICGGQNRLEDRC